MRRRVLTLVLVVALAAGAVVVAQTAVLPILPPVTPPTIAWDVVVAIGAGFTAFAFKDEISETFEYIGTSIQSLFRYPRETYTAGDLASSGTDYSPAGVVSSSVNTFGAERVRRHIAAIPMWSAVSPVVWDGDTVQLTRQELARRYEPDNPYHNSVSIYGQSAYEQFDIGTARFTGGPQSALQEAQLLAYAVGVEYYANLDYSSDYWIVHPTMYNVWAQEFEDATDGAYLGQPLAGTQDDEDIRNIQLEVMNYDIYGEAQGVGHTSVLNAAGVITPVEAPDLNQNYDYFIETTAAWTEYFVVPMSIRSSSYSCGGAYTDVMGYELYRLQAVLTGVEYAGEGFYNISFSAQLSYVTTMGLADTSARYVVDGEMIDGAWAAMWVTSFANLLGWHSAIWHWSRGQNDCSVTYPPLTVLLDDATAPYPWDIEGAADSGWALRLRDGAEVLWIVKPLDALIAAFTPTIAISDRMAGLQSVLESRWPFNVVSALSWGAGVGAEPLQLVGFSFNGLSINPDNGWLNALGSVIRLAASVLLITLLVVWVRGKLMPRTVI